jgi:hypothetical protein
MSISNKIAALTLTTLLALTAAGSAFAASQPSTPVKGGAKVLVAQSPLLSHVLVITYTALGNAFSIAQSQAIGGSGKGALAQSIYKATFFLENATALSGSTAISDQLAVERSLSRAETVLGDALAIAQSNAISGPGKPALAYALSIAKTSVCNRTTIGHAIAQSR